MSNFMGFMSVRHESNDIYKRIINYLKRLNLADVNVDDVYLLLDTLKIKQSLFPNLYREALEGVVEYKLSNWFVDLYQRTFLNNPIWVVKMADKPITLNEYSLFESRLRSLLELLNDYSENISDLGESHSIILYTQLITAIERMGEKNKEAEMISIVKKAVFSEQEKTETVISNLSSLDKRAYGHYIETSNNYNTWVNQKVYEDCLYQWSIFIKFSSENYTASKINKFLWAFSETLESISGFYLEIESIGTGSLWYKLRAFIKSPEAKNEAVELLQKGRDALTSQYLDKPIVDNGKTGAEARKANAEAKKVEKENELIPTSEYIQKKQELELRKLEAEARKLELENIERSVNIAEKLAYMIKEGMLSADTVSININGLPYLTSEKGKLIEGSSLEAIDAASLIKPSDDEDEIKA